MKYEVSLDHIVQDFKFRHLTFWKSKYLYNHALEAMSAMCNITCIAIYWLKACSACIF